MKTLSYIIYGFATLTLIIYIFFSDYLPGILLQNKIKMILFWTLFLLIVVFEMIKKKLRK